VDRSAQEKKTNQTLFFNTTKHTKVQVNFHKEKEQKTLFCYYYAAKSD